MMTQGHKDGSSGFARLMGTTFLLKLKMITTVALLSAAVARIWYTPVMLCSDFSTRLTISRSTVSGEAPGTVA